MLIENIQLKDLDKRVQELSINYKIGVHSEIDGTYTIIAILNKL